MKKIFSLLSLGLMVIGLTFVSCGDLLDDDESNVYATTTIGTPSVTSKAYPGVNILTWKAIKDASSYTVYRTAGNGNIEETGVTSSNVYYIDTDIDEETSYKYRIVANPSDATVHDASQTEVSLKTAKTATGTNLKGTWAAEDTAFSDLAQYESDYNANAEVLSADTITAKLLTSTGSKVRVSFPTKAYANYTVYLSQVNGGLVNSSRARETSTSVAGYTVNGTATVTLDALYSGTKQITVIATPLNSTLYRKSVFASTATVEVKALDSISSAVSGSVSAEWTNYTYSSKKASARVYFTPYSYDGAEFGTDEYTIYRAVYTGSEDSSTLTNSSGDSLRIYDSITNIGSPKKDTSVPVNEETVYYLDDSINIKDVAGIRYYVVLNHNGYLKTNTSRIVVPSSSDSSWNFTPDADSTTVTNSVSIYDIYIENDGTFYLKADSTSSGTLSVTYGAFDTLNEAKVAVESELPNKLTTTDSSYSSYPVYTGVAVNTSKYYAFRVLSEKTGADDVVATTIAKPVAVGGAYYFDIQTNYPSNYATTGSASLSLTSDLGENNYKTVQLSYYASNAKYYNIYRYVSSYNDSSYFDSFSELLETVTSTSYTDKTVSSISVGKYIFYKVVAVGYYDFANSSVYRASRLSTPIVSFDSSSNKLSWNSVNDATNYCIYRATSESALSELSEDNYYYKTTTYSYTTSYDVISSYTSDYYYAVRAYDSSNYEYSNMSTKIIHVVKAEAPVATPSESNGSVSISWPAVKSATRYYIYRATSEDALTALGNTQKYATIDSDSTSYTASKSYNSTYYYAIRAYNSLGEYTANSNIVTVEKIPAPTIELSENDNLTISWNPVANASAYYVYRATSEEALNSLENYQYYTTPNDSDSTSYTASQEYTTYYYAVRAYNGSEYTANSNIVTVSKIPAPTIELSESDNVTISWNSVPNATAYYIYRATSEDALKALGNSQYYTDSDSTSYTASQSYNSAYYYAIKAYNGTEYTDLSNIVTIERDTSLGENIYIWEKSSDTTTYYFAEGEEAFVWKSNNQNLGNTTATSTWTITIPSEVSYTIAYSVSSESGYDKLSVTLDGNNIITNISGEITNTYTITLSAGTHTLVASYSKDGSSNNGADAATITLDKISF